MTSHDTYRERLLDLAYGELGRRDARALRAHLEGCAECRAELARMTATRSAMSALPPEPAPERGEAVLLAAAREAARERRPKPFLPSWVWGASVGAVGVAAVALLAVRLAGTVRSPVSQPEGSELVSRSAQAGEAKAAAPAAEPAPSAAATPAPPPAVAGKVTAAPAKPVPEPGGEAGLRDEVEGERRREPSGAATDAGPLGLKERPDRKPAPMKRKAAPPPGGGDEADLIGGAVGAPHRPDQPDGYSRSAGRGSAGGAAKKDALSANGAPAAARSEAPPAAEPEPSVSAPSEFARPPPPAARASEGGEAPGLEHEQDAAAAQEKREAPAPLPRAGEAKGRVARSATEDAIARHERLRAAGKLHTATASFRDCPGEASRQVERDDEGRVVKVTRRGTVDGTPFEAEQFYGEDGLLGAVRYRAAGAVRELHLGGPGAAAAGGVPAFALEPRHAADATLDAPPRCGG